MTRKMVFVDTSKCTGCKACPVACKAWNELPAEKTRLVTSFQTHKDFTPNTFTYITFTEKYENQKNIWLTRKAQCFHCADPACMKACPQKAIYQTDSGYVLVDQDKCIGCGYCATNCPFGVPKVDEVKKKAFRCVGCIDRVENDLVPACVHTCGPGALSFGERDAKMAEAKKRLAEVQKTNPKAQLYGEKEMGGTTFVYLLMDSPEAYGLPVNPTIPLSLTLWKDGIQPLFKYVWPATACAVVIGGISNLLQGNYRNRGHEENDSKKGGKH
ncbi:(4Fe-4S)-binding protein [Desulfosporosinus sp. Tol-M]|nr:(4Fe-4S)-binding protein [Desulfosporosinus sp. Tol-M]